MNKNGPKHYNNVYFDEYLDGGYQDIPYFNQQLLNQASTTFGYPKKANHNQESSLCVNDLLHESLQNTPVRNNENNNEYLHALSRISEELLGKSATKIEYPGGSGRSSLRLILSDHSSVIVTQRPVPARASYEASIMQLLQNQNASTPKVLGFNGLVLFQEDLPGIRLSETLLTASPTEQHQLLAKALTSLANIHAIGSHASLDTSVPIIGCSPDWLISFIDRTAIMGNHFDIPTPKIPVRAIFDLLTLLKPRFVKWDARPGNAIVDENNQIQWFDWEHCCARNRLDDVAWLLCDESVSDLPDVETALLDEYLMDFADGMNFRDAHTYLRLFGIHHMCVRVARLLSLKVDESWDFVDDEYKNGRRGTALGDAQRLCDKAARWSLATPYTHELHNWFLSLRERLAMI